MNTYSEICAVAKKMGVFPDENPSESALEKLRAISSDCLTAYEKGPGDAELMGWYLYYQSEQAGELRESDGVCSITEDGTAVIGLSYELLHTGLPEYCRIVGLHELAHLCEGAHNEQFARRQMELEYQYFSRKARADGRAMPRTKRRNKTY